MEYDGFHASQDNWSFSIIVVSELTNTTGCGPLLESNGFASHFSLFTRLPLLRHARRFPWFNLLLGIVQS